MEQTTINGRIAWVISLLEISQNTFAKILETSASRVSNITSGRNKPDSDFLAAMAKKFTNVNSAWLLTGEGQPLLTQNSSQVNDKGYPILDEPYGLANVLKEIDLRNKKAEVSETSRPAKSPKKIFVTSNLPMPAPDADLQTGFGSSKDFGKRAFAYKARPSTDAAATHDTSEDPTYAVIDFEAAATYATGYQSEEYYESLATATMPRVLVGSSRQGILFQVEGDSMAPRFQHGDWVAAELLSPDEWGAVRDFNCCIVVSTANGIQFKRVRNRLMTTLKSIQCNSDNRRYDSFDIESENLLQLFRFVLHISSDASNPNDDIYKKVDNLADTTSDLYVRYEQLAQQIAAMQGAVKPVQAPENAK